MIEAITTKQKQVLECVEQYWSEHGVPPSISDLAQCLGVKKATTYEHLMALKKKGLLQHREGAGRTWKPVAQLQPVEVQASGQMVPLLGCVAAGLPILAEQNIESWLPFDRGLRSSHDLFFALRVVGQSMVGVSILHGDIVIARKQEAANNGDIVVALVDGESATVKRFRHSDGVVHLVAENPDYLPIELRGDRVQILGKVVEVRRTVT
jgi:repressor LexA